MPDEPVHGIETAIQVIVNRSNHEYMKSFKTIYQCRRLVLALTGSLLFGLAFCQGNFRPGKIVGTDGDTLEGYIDFQNMIRNPEKIFFREKLSDDSRTLLPSDIKGFLISNQRYESAVIQTEVSPVTDEQLIYEPNLILETDTVFLQTISRGPVNLYYFINRIGKEQFYIRADTSHVLLVYKRYLKENEDGRLVAIENRKYRNQLLVYFRDCPEISGAIGKTAYEEIGLILLFRKYNNCMGLKRT
jgi:hypothetical protein